MTIQKLKGVLLLALLFIIPLCSSAKFPGILQRYQLGYSFVINSAQLTNGTKITGAGSLDRDTSYKTNFNTSAAFGVTMGTYVPLARLGRASTLVLGIDFMYNMMTWKSKVPAFGGEIDFSGVTAQMALPIGLDFKFGADAINVKDRRFCATIGAGAFPSYALTALDNAEGLSIDPAFSVAPYVKGEVGIFAGICMKLRAVYAIGNLTYMDLSESTNTAGVTSTSTTKFLGTSNLTVSLLIMPFSFTWKKEEWWNTF